MKIPHYAGFFLPINIRIQPKHMKQLLLLTSILFLFTFCNTSSNNHDGIFLRSNFEGPGQAIRVSNDSLYYYDSSNKFFSGTIHQTNEYTYKGDKWFRYSFSAPTKTTFWHNSSSDYWVSRVCRNGDENVALYDPELEYPLKDGYRAMLCAECICGRYPTIFSRNETVSDHIFFSYAPKK